MSFLGGLGGMLEGGIGGNVSGLVPSVNAMANQGKFGAIPQALAPRVDPSARFGAPGGALMNGIAGDGTNAGVGQNIDTLMALMKMFGGG